jgi:hypothetical protein
MCLYLSATTLCRCPYLSAGVPPMHRCLHLSATTLYRCPHPVQVSSLYTGVSPLGHHTVQVSLSYLSAGVPPMHRCLHLSATTLYRCPHPVQVSSLCTGVSTLVPAHCTGVPTLVQVSYSCTGVSTLVPPHCTGVPTLVPPQCAGVPTLVPPQCEVSPPHFIANNTIDINELKHGYLKELIGSRILINEEGLELGLTCSPNPSSCTLSHHVRFYLGPQEGGRAHTPVRICQ